jgi:hypothetical protein
MPEKNQCVLVSCWRESMLLGKSIVLDGVDGIG